MVNSNVLREKINAKGIKYNFLAEQLGLSPYGLALKIDNQNEFKISEVSKLCDLLGITSLREKESIFFASSVE